MAQTDPDLHLGQIGATLVPGGPGPHHPRGRGLCRPAPAWSTTAARSAATSVEWYATRTPPPNSFRSSPAASSTAICMGPTPAAGQVAPRLRRGRLSHLVADHHKWQRRRRRSTDCTGPQKSRPCPTSGTGPSWPVGTRSYSPAAGQRLEAVERATGEPFYTVLHSSSRPDLHRRRWRRSWAPAWGNRYDCRVGQTLHRARERFADLLLDEIANALKSPSLEHLEQELNDLGLLDHCRSALEQQGDSGGARWPGPAQGSGTHGHARTTSP